MGSMMVHRLWMHGKEPGIDWNPLLFSQMEHIPQVFDVSFPTGTSQCKFPFTSCLRSLRTCNGVWNHLNRQHWRGKSPDLGEAPHPISKIREVR